MQVFKTLLIVLIIIFTVSFVFENRWIIEEHETIRYYTLFQPREIPLVLLFLGNILFGALLMAVPSFIKNHHLKRALKENRKKIAQMEKELSSLRNLPITEEKNIERINKET